MMGISFEGSVPGLKRPLLIMYHHRHFTNRGRSIGVEVLARGMLMFDGLQASFLPSFAIMGHELLLRNKGVSRVLIGRKFGHSPRKAPDEQGLVISALIPWVHFLLYDD